MRSAQLRIVNAKQSLSEHLSLASILSFLVLVFEVIKHNKGHSHTHEHYATDAHHGWESSEDHNYLIGKLHLCEFSGTQAS